MSKNIFLDNDFESEVAITRKNATNGAEEAATGLALTSHLAAVDSSTTPIHADLSKTMTERSGKAGTYYAVFEGDDLRARLATSYIGQVVYEVVGDGTNVLTSRPRRVYAVRRPGH